jgi:hypothetical protein
MTALDNPSAGGATVRPSDTKPLTIVSSTTRDTQEARRAAYFARGGYAVPGHRPTRLTLRILPPGK